MTQEDLANIYHKVLHISRKKALSWKRSSVLRYTVSFANSTIEIAKDYDYSPPEFVFTIYNSDGLIIAYVTTEKSEEYEDRVVYYKQNVEELFNVVEEQVYKLTETKNDLLDILDDIERSIK